MQLLTTSAAPLGLNYVRAHAVVHRYLPAAAGQPEGKAAPEHVSKVICNRLLRRELWADPLYNL